MILPSLLSYLPSISTRRARLTTEQVLTAALSDIHTFRALLPSPQLPSCLRQFNVAIRISAILVTPYLFLTYLIPIPIILGVVGTFVLSCRAPWAQALSSILIRSAYVRWASAHAWRILSGTTLETLSVMSTTPRPASPVRFLFTVLECQRWWVGLDWTAALLPGERPSWCTVNYQAITPPSVFVLPPATSVFLPGQNNKRIKHTAMWRWADPEWGVLVNKDGTGVKRIEKQPPGVPEDEEKDSAGSRLKRAATMLKDRTSAISNAPDKDKKDGETPAPAAIPDAEVTLTDVDGWVYGDNKWEAPSAKGGLGKYTRFRRWTRIATLEETIQEVGPGLLGLVKDVASPPHVSHKDAKSTVKDACVMSDAKPKNFQPDSPPSNSNEPVSSNSSPRTAITPDPRTDTPVSSSISISNNHNLDKDQNKSDQNHFSKVLEDTGNSFRERLKNVVKSSF